MGKGWRFVLLLAAVLAACGLTAFGLYARQVERDFASELQFPVQVRLSVWRNGQEREVEDPTQKAELLGILRGEMGLRSVFPPSVEKFPSEANFYNIYVWSGAEPCYVPVTVPRDNPGRAFLGGRERLYAVTGGESLLHFADKFFA